MDRTDLVLLYELRKNSRATMRDISDKTKLTMSLLFRRLDKLNKSVVKRYVSLIDFSKLDYPFRVLFVLTTHNKNDDFSMILDGHANVNNLFLANDGDELIADIYFKDMAEVHDFKEQLLQQGIEVRMHHIIEQIKVEGFLTDEKHLKTIPVLDST